MCAQQLFTALLSSVSQDQLADFTCGDESWAEELNDFLKNDAYQDHEQSLNRTHLFFTEDRVCIGFVTLLASQVRREEGGFLLKGDTSYPAIPAVLIGRFAVDESFQGSGYGEEIMAWTRNLARELPIGCRFLAVDVDKENEGAIRFYKREGFELVPVKRKLRFLLYDLVASVNG